MVVASDTVCADKRIGFPTTLRIIKPRRGLDLALSKMQKLCPRHVDHTRNRPNVQGSRAPKVLAGFEHVT